MILIRDAFKLSLTKLRIRIPRLVITTIISSLLFALAVFVVAVVSGSIQSANSFGSQGLSSRLLVAGTAGSINQNSDAVIKDLEKAQAAYIQQKQAAAKRLGIEYDPKQEPSWVEKGSDYQGVNFNIPQVQEYLNKAGNNDSINFDAFKSFVVSKGASTVYRVSQEGFQPSSGLSVIKDGKESFSAKAESATSWSPIPSSGFKSLESSKLNMVDDGLLKSYVTNDQQLIIDPTDQSLPVIVPFSVAEESLGLTKLPKSANANEQLNRIQEVRSKVLGQKVQVCYRNEKSLELVRLAQQQKQELEKDKNSLKDQQVLYELPSTACGNVIITKDTRTAEQKQYDAKQEEFDALFGKPKEQSMLKTFRIVGLKQDVTDTYDSSLAGLITSSMASNIATGWLIPSSVVTDSNLIGFVNDYIHDNKGAIYIAELPDEQTMKAFIKQYSCKASEVFNSPGNAPVISQANTLEACIMAGTPFYFMNYGNNAVAIAEFQKGFNKIFNIVIAVIAVLSGLILMGIIGRIIADGRRETAVFRAIGATRLDMSTVYGLYAFMIATLVVVASFVLGLSAAALFSAHFSPAATPNALLAFNVADLSKKFVFIGFDLPNMLKIAGVIYLAALLGTLPPLAGNLHRNPLKDMRDEN